jgi:hypothetical protein
MNGGDQAQLREDVIAADVTGVQNEIDARKRRVDSRSEEAVSV